MPLLTRLNHAALLLIFLSATIYMNAAAPVESDAQAALPSAIEVGGWMMQDAANVSQVEREVASPVMDTRGWYTATVPGTALTTLVDNHVYPEPLYGENNRPEIIPDSLAQTAYWYRTVVTVPKDYAGRRVWLNFKGINYSATIWVNGVEVGKMRGAFIRGNFDITEQVKPGASAVVAVLVAPQPHLGVPHEHTLRAGVGLNGGDSALDGPTFLSTIGWDWLPTIRDRDTGIWQKVTLSASGPVVVKDPLVTTDLPLPRTDSADVAVSATLENVSGKEVRGVLKGTIDNIEFERTVEIDAHSTKLMKFSAKDVRKLHMLNPLLWWPNGYGPQNLYQLHLSFEVHTYDEGKKGDDVDVSDEQVVEFGVRKITYNVPDSDNLTISVNGVRIFIRGGDWGLDEAMKRIPRARLEAEMRYHQMANLNMVRNWVGQSTSEDFYELCDKYGMLVWDEFFQPGPTDGPDPLDDATYIANVRDKVLQYRNHPSIAVWCARNEGNPPKEIDDGIRKLMTELEPTRMYQPSSTDGHGVRSNGPYRWRTPREFYTIKDDYFKTETGSVSVPTLESVHGMMPQKDWEMIGDDWAEHDFAKGNSGADEYPAVIAARYGKIANLADFVRKGQMANYEAYRAMYEGRNALLFHPTTGVITWMSNPAQPSFVWQLYHYDLEPNASLFAVMHAAELQHIQLNEATGVLQVINNLPTALKDAVARVAIYNLDGTLAYEHETKVTAEADSATNVDAVEFTAGLSAAYFVKLELLDSAGQLISSNFYWRGTAEYPDDLTAMDAMPMVVLTAQADMKDVDGKRVVSVTLHNPTKHIAVMAHLQLRRNKSGLRVLPVFYSDNYVSLLPNETRTITITANLDDFHGEDAMVMVDGWNATVAPEKFSGVAVAPNLEAQPGHWPVTGLPYQTVGLR
jgi:hypothetical protein